MARYIKRSSDGEVIDLENAEANQADITANAKRVIVTDGTNNIAVDSIDSSIGTITSAHIKVHQGNFYNISKLFENVADDSNAEILLKVGSNKKLHFTTIVTVGGTSHVYLYESPTVSDNGTQLAIYNMNRSSSNTSDATAYYSPTVASAGTELSSVLAEGGTGPKAIGSQARNDGEWILEKSTDYLIRVTNKSGAVNDISIEIAFYESD